MRCLHPCASTTVSSKMGALALSCEPVDALLSPAQKEFGGLGVKGAVRGGPQAKKGAFRPGTTHRPLRTRHAALSWASTAHRLCTDLLVTHLRWGRKVLPVILVCWNRAEPEQD